MFDSSDFKVVDGMSGLIEMDCNWVTFICAFAVYVRAVTCHSFLEFLAGFPDILDIANGTFN